MATTLSRYLKLRISSNLDSDSKYNLSKIDSLGAVYQTNTNEQVVIRSSKDIIIQPNSIALGGSGSGGSLFLGTEDHPLSSVSVHSAVFSLGSQGLALADMGIGGDFSLRLKYDSTLSGSVESVSDRNLTFDLQGADRSVILGGSLTLLNNSLSLSAPIPTTWVLPPTTGTSGQALVTDGAGTLTWANPAVSNSTSAYYIWSSGEGSSKTITHSFNSLYIDVVILDANDNYNTIGIGDIQRVSTSSITLVASQAPLTTWIVLISKIG